METVHTRNDNSQTSESHSGLSSIISKIPKWLWPALLVLFFIIKVDIVAHGDMTSMAVIVNSTSSLTGMALSALTASLVWVVGAVTWFWVIHFMENLREGDSIAIPIVAVIIGLAGCLAFLPAGSFIFIFYFVIFTTVWSLVARYIWPKIKEVILHKPHRFLPTNRTRDGEIAFTFVFVIPLAFIVLLGTGTWLPSEIITTGDGKTVSGYLINVDDNSVVLLQQKNHQVIHIAHPSIIKRTACVATGLGQRSLLSKWLWREDTTYKRC